MYTCSRELESILKKKRQIGGHSVRLLQGGAEPSLQ